MSIAIGASANVLGSAASQVLSNGSSSSGNVSGSTSISGQQLSQILTDGFQSGSNPIGNLGSNVYNDISSIFNNGAGGLSGTDESHLIEAGHDSELFEAASSIDKQDGGNGTVNVQDLEKLRDKVDKGDTKNTPRLDAMISQLQNQGGGTINSASDMYNDLSALSGSAGQGIQFQQSTDTGTVS